MKNIIILIPLLWLAAALLAGSCKRPEEAKPVVVEPELITYYLPSSGPFASTEIQTDTFYILEFVEFKVNLKYDTYEYRVGSDPRIFSNANFKLRFLGQPGDYSIRFIGSRKNENEVVIDTIYKNIHIFNDWMKLPIYGKYAGKYEDGTADTIELIILPEGQFGYSHRDEPSQYSHRVYSIHCDKWDGQVVNAASNSFETFFWSTHNDCDISIALKKVYNTNEVEGFVYRGSFQTHLSFGNIHEFNAHRENNKLKFRGKRI